jgi:hypothetical protein
MPQSDKTIGGCRLVTHEAVEPGLLYAVGPCPAREDADHDASCQHCGGLGIYAVRAANVGSSRTDLASTHDAPSVEDQTP